MRSALWVEHTLIAEQGIEDAGQAAGEGDDGDGLATARRDVEGPRPEGLGLGRSAPEDGDRGLNQEPAHASLASLGNGAAALTLPGAEFARHQAEVRFDLMGTTEAADVVDRGDEGRGRHGPDAGDRAQALDALISSITWSE